MSKPRRMQSVRVKESPIASETEHDDVYEECVNDTELMQQARKIKAQCEAAQVRFRDVTAALKAAREQKGMTLRDVEAITGIASGNLSLLENGSGNPTIETLERIAHAIGAEIRIVVCVG